MKWTFGMHVFNPLTQLFWAINIKKCNTGFSTGNTGHHICWTKLTPVGPQCVLHVRMRLEYIHCFWECPRIVHFWSRVTKELNLIFKCKLCKDPGKYLLGLPSKIAGVLDPGRSKLLNKLLLLARKCILFNWIQVKPPTITQWYNEVFRVLPMERLSAKLRGKTTHSWTYGGPW